MKIRPLGAELYHAEGKTDMTLIRSCFSQFRKRALTTNHMLYGAKVTVLRHAKHTYSADRRWNCWMLNLIARTVTVRPTNVNSVPHQVSRMSENRQRTFPTTTLTRFKLYIPLNVLYEGM